LLDRGNAPIEFKRSSSGKLGAFCFFELARRLVSVANRQANYQPMRRVADLLSPSKRAATPPTKKGRLRTLENDVRIVCPGSLDEGGRSRDRSEFALTKPSRSPEDFACWSAGTERGFRANGTAERLAKSARGRAQDGVYLCLLWTANVGARHCLARVLVAKTFSECSPISF
jgi:hypothetical protein